MKISRSVLAPVFVALTALVTGGWLLQRGVSEEQSIYANAQLFDDVMRYVSDRFVDAPERDELYQMAIDGMLEKLGDPHSTFMSANEYERLRVQTQGEYAGIGIQIARRNGWVTVIAPLPGTPGERAGLQAGDAIIEVDGQSTREWSEDIAVANLRGKEGSTVNLKIARVGVDEPISFAIERADIHLRSVPSSYMLPGGVGYLELSVFSETSTDEVKAAIDQLRSEGARSIVLDMRGNPGGLLDQGINVTDLFLPKGVTIAETRSRDEGMAQRFTAVSPESYDGLPLVVLVSPSSASATEIVAGALQDHDRALVLGRTSYGKGSVQSLLPLKGNNWLKLTTARWYTPSGRSIQAPYGIGDHAVEEIADGPSAVTSESETERPEYKTASGRTVLGGGGIIPDLEVMPDTLTAGERVFTQTLQQHGSKYAEAAFAYAVQVVRSTPGLQPGFEVTQAMKDGFLSALHAADIAVERAAFEEAARLVERDLAYQITYAKWGQAEARKRLNEEDPQVRVAADLLRRATSPASLFSLAAEYAAAHPKATVPAGANE